MKHNAEFDADVELPRKPRGLEDDARQVRRWGWRRWGAKDTAHRFLKRTESPPSTGEIRWLYRSFFHREIDLDRARKVHADGGRARGSGLWERRRVVLAEFEKLRADPARRKQGDCHLCKILAERFRADVKRGEHERKFDVRWLTVWLDLRAARRGFPA